MDEGFRGTSSPGRGAVRAISIAGVLVAAGAVAVRCVHPESDAYTGLCFSQALATDEGLYAAAARSEALGHDVPDVVRLPLLTPLFHLALRAAFAIGDPGIVAARLVSVTTSLLAVAVLHEALRRAHGRFAALLGALFLGLDHFSALHGRLALQDAVAILPMTLAYLASVLAAESVAAGRSSWTARALWLFSGAALGAAFATRSLTILAVPGVLLAASPLLSGDGAAPSPRGGRGRWDAVVSTAGGLAAALALYAVLWWLPQRESLAERSAHFLTNRLAPQDAEHFFAVVGRSLFGERRGMTATLFEHSPVVVSLSLLAVTWAACRGWRGLPPVERASAAFLGGWFVSMAGALVFANYNASRYWMGFFPAMCGLAAVTLVRGREAVSVVLASRAARSALAAFLAWHVALAVLPETPRGERTLVPAAAAVVAFLAAAIPAARAFGTSQVPAPPRAAVAAALVAWAALNAAWYADWLGSLGHRQREAGEWLGANLPADAVVVGTYAPGLCLHNHLATVGTIGKSEAVRDVLARCSGRPRYLLVLESPNRDEPWWREWHPDVVDPAHVVRSFPANFRPSYRLDLYRVPEGADVGR